MKIKEHANFTALKNSLDNYIKDFGEREINETLLTANGAPIQEFAILMHNSTGAVKNKFSDICAKNATATLEKKICLLLSNAKGEIDKFATFKDSVKANINKGRDLDTILDFLGDTEEKQTIIKNMFAEIKAEKEKTESKGEQKPENKK